MPFYPVLREPQLVVKVVVHSVGFAREQAVELVHLEVEGDFDNIVSVAAVYTALAVLATLVEEAVVAFVRPIG